MTENHLRQHHVAPEHWQIREARVRVDVHAATCTHARHMRCKRHLLADVRAEKAAFAPNVSQLL
jgi:hypothetical protein